jgi:hypothetical protein
MQDHGHLLMLLCDFCEFWQVGLAPIMPSGTHELFQSSMAATVAKSKTADA